MKKIAITGATGFVGKNLIEFINKEEYEIYCLVRNSFVENVVNYKVDLFHQTEIVKFMEDVKPDILIHLAWNVENQSYWHSLENNQWAIESIFLVEQFLKYGGKYVIFAGTSASYDYERKLLIEDSRMECPSSLYGISKLYSSQVIRKMAADAGAGFLEARLFAVFGDYERNGRLIPNTIQLLMSGKKVINNKWGLERDYIYIKDAANAIVYLMEREICGVYNISSGQAVTLKRIIQSIATQLEKEELLICEDFVLGEDVPCIIGCNKKLLETGFEYSYSMDEAIAQTIQWYKSIKML